ncbi:hypothetical protein [uncultured Marinobacter sp.]|uniref:hypothetical protein n=1 Tax=uncultured Marinobacter sp. TaxID=187379 RepID=UPI0030D8D710
MTEKLTENQLLKGLNAYGAHADEFFSPSGEIFAFRTFDLRDRFPKPFPDFRSALEALQGPDAYLPESSGSIVAYARDGREFPIPDTFYIQRPLQFEDRAAAEQFIRERQAAIAQNEPLARLSGMAFTNPDDPFEKQLADAMAARRCVLVPATDNDEVCEQVAQWLLTQLEPAC